MTDLTVGGETFRVVVEGDETLPVLLLCHPLGGDLHIWDAQIPAFTKRFRVVRYDARGHGGSTLARAPYSIIRLGLDAVAILDALEIEKAHVLGLSMGGAVAQWLLIHAPSRVERAVLANTAATFGAAASWNGRILAAQKHGMASLLDATMERWFSDAFVAGNGAALEPIRRTFVATAPEGFAASCAALRDMDLREDLRRIGHPVLVIAGRDDPSVSAEQAALLAETIGGARLMTLETRHVSSVEDPEGFAEAVMGFLTARAPVRRGTPRKLPLSLPAARRPAGRRTAATRGPTARAAPAKSTEAKTAGTKSAGTKSAGIRPKTAVASASKKPKPSGAKRPARKNQPATTPAKATAPAKGQAARAATLKTADKGRSRKAPAAPAPRAAPKNTAAKSTKAKPGKRPAVAVVKLAGKTAPRVAAKARTAAPTRKAAAAKVTTPKKAPVKAAAKPAAPAKGTKPAARAPAAKTARRPAAKPAKRTGARRKA